MRPTAHRNRTRISRIILLALLLAACSPRELPPQLAFTAAPAYTLTDETLVTEAYTVSPPRGWRIIAGPAENPFTFQFITPENDALIVVSDRPLEQPPMPSGADAAQLEISPSEADIGGRKIYVVLVSAQTQTAVLTPVRDALLASLR